MAQQQQQAVQQLMPLLSAYVELPELLDPSGPALSRVNRAHSAAVKDALRATLIDHHRQRIPKHFQQTARGRYGYYPRRPGYKRRKLRRYHSMTDLVKTGRTRRKMIGGYDRLTVRGSAAAGHLEGKMILKFPFAREPRKGPGVSVARMADEISRWTLAEQQEASQLFIVHYRDGIDRRIKSKRVRKRLAGRLRALGIRPN